MPSRPSNQSNQGGLKFDAEKIRLDLIPSESIEEIGRVLTFGCKKYGEANWAKGIAFSRLIAAAKRHLSTWEKGEEDIDPETQTIHIANAATNLLFLIWMIKNRPDLDDRWQKKVKNEKATDRKTKRKRTRPKKSKKTCKR